MGYDLNKEEELTSFQTMEQNFLTTALFLVGVGISYFVR